MIDRQAFFPLAAAILGGDITNTQKDGISAIIDEWDRRKLSDLRWLAYILATVHRETGGKYQPITESLNYSVEGLKSNFGRHRISVEDAERFGRYEGHRAEQEKIGEVLYGGEWGAKNLGNTERGDGFKFRGRGLVQTTGRRLYRLFGQRLGIDLVANPDRVLEMGLSVTILFDGMIEGLNTGKELADYFNDDRADWREARRIVNALDRADEIAETAKRYHAALKAAYRAGPPGVPPRAEPPPAKPTPPLQSPQPVQPKPEPKSLWERLIAWLVSLFPSRA